MYFNPDTEREYRLHRQEFLTRSTEKDEFDDGHRIVGAVYPVLVWGFRTEHRVTHIVVAFQL